MTAPGWYQAEGDPPGTTRYWDGVQWVGDPVATAPPSYPTAPGAPAAAYGGVQLASPGSRIGARVIDFIISTLVGLIFVVPLIIEFIDELDALGPNPSQAEIDALTTDVFVSSPWLLGSFALAFFWDALWVGLVGGTPGKLMLGIRVADAKTHKVPPGLIKGVLRALNRAVLVLAVFSAGSLNAVNGIAGLIGLISLIMLFADSQHRTVMDRIASTIVRQK